MRYIDISKYQPTVDYSKLKSDGVEGVMIRVVSTNNDGVYIDTYFKQHYDGCKKYGIPVGAYWYTEAQSISEVEKELKYVFSMLNNRQFELPIAVDVESNYIKSIGKTALTDIVLHALQTLEKSGYYAMWYTYKNYLSNLETDRLKNYDFWLAYYTIFSSPNVGIKYGMHQYTSTGKISAINGNVDMNRFYKDYPTIIKNAGLNGYGEKKTDVNSEVKKELNEVIETLKKIFDKL